MEVTLLDAWLYITRDDIEGLKQYLERQRAQFSKTITNCFGVKMPAVHPQTVLRLASACCKAKDISYIQVLSHYFDLQNIRCELVSVAAQTKRWKTVKFLVNEYS